LVISDDEFEGMSDKEREAYKVKRNAEFVQMKNIVQVISGLSYDPELLNRKMGMPVITYYGDNPDPINYADRKKVYGSGVIKDMYLRLLLTQRFKDFKMFMLISTIAFVIIAISNAGFYYNAKGLIAANKQCLAMLNNSITTHDVWVNQTLSGLMQRSSEVII
jgi:hypothetical protein